jgi:SAM-dependent methyltransferase
MARFYRQRVGRWARLFPQPGRVFEMGCGTGLMLATLRDLGWQVLGSERTEAAAEIPRRLHGLDVLAHGLDGVDPAARFDLIILNQVLEHLEDPKPTLERLAPMLTPGGRLVIGVPNFASWQAVFGGAGWLHLDVPRHLHHFSPRALALLLERCGLVIDAVTFISPEHDPYGWVQSTLNRLAPDRPNRLTRFLMRFDPPDGGNLLHLALGGLIGVIAVPLSIVSWIARRGAIIEVIGRRLDRPG